MRSAITFLSLSLGLAACVDAPATSSTTQQSVARNMLASNMLASNQLASNMLASNMLASNMLASNMLASNQLGSGMLLSTPDGRTVMSYILSCALPSGTTVVADKVGACVTDADCATPPGNTTIAGACDIGNNTCTYNFFGVVGLTPEWIHKPLDQTGRHWISACLFARINAHATSEEISLRGENKALQVSPDEQLLFSLEEGAFWGNVFRDNKSILWVACTGRDLAQGVSGGLTIRDCAKPDPANPGFTKCGFVYAGNCGAFNAALPRAPHACRQFESAPGQASFYEGCRQPVADRPRPGGATDRDDGGEHGDRPHDGGHNDNDPDDGDNRASFDEVITTFVAS
jgi:hypothetical protein